MYTDNMDGLGKSKFKKIFKKFSPQKMLKTKLMMPFAPAMTMKKKKGKKKNRIAPVVQEQASQLPTDGRPTMSIGRPVFFSPEQRDDSMYDSGTVQRPMPMPAPYIEPRPEPGARAIPQDFYSNEEFFPTQLDYGYVSEDTGIENAAILTPYESAAAATFGNEEDFMDTASAWESEAGFLNGLGQESGSTGGWFTDFVSTGAKALVEIRKARAADKASRRVATNFPAYRPMLGSGFGGFDLNKILMFGAIGLGGFFLYKNIGKKR